MKNVSPISAGLIAVFVFFSPVRACSDEISDLDSKVELLKKRLAVASAENDLLEQQKLQLAKLTEIEKQKKALGDAKIAAINNTIKIYNGKVISNGSADLTCSATPFLAFTCNGKEECSFNLNSDICGDPSGVGGNKVMINYACGRNVQNVELIFGKMGYLTCK